MAQQMTMLKEINKGKLLCSSRKPFIFPGFPELTELGLCTDLKTTSEEHGLLSEVLRTHLGTAILRGCRIHSGVNSIFSIQEKSQHAICRRKVEGAASTTCRSIRE